MSHHQAIVRHKFYRSEVVIDGWLVVRFVGIFHRHRAISAIDDCKIKAQLTYITEKEKVHDEENVKFIR
jgi:hypothetical protein